MPAQAVRSAGALLREARLERGLELVELAAQLKVSPRKLEALEADRHEDLQGPIFVRALVQSVCRVMRVDAAPILAGLPQAQPVQTEGLERVNNGLNRPFSASMSERASPLAGLRRHPGVLVLMGVFVLGAVVLSLLPSEWTEVARTELASAGTAGASQAATETPPEPVPAPPVAPIASERLPAGVLPASGPANMVTEHVTLPGQAASAAVAVASVPAVAPQAIAPVLAVVAPSPSAAPASAAVVAGGPAALQLSARQMSWVEVQDATGRTLIGRALAAGEKVELQGVVPLRLKVGNVAGTDVVFRGKPLKLSELTRDNVARLELK